MEEWNAGKIKIDCQLSTFFRALLFALCSLLFALCSLQKQTQNIINV